MMHFRKRASTVASLPPRPSVVAASGEFDGNDGNWSTFFVNIGDEKGTGSGQNFKVLISTSSGITLVPAQTEWCDLDCAKNRGIQTYNGQQVRGLNTDTATWNKAGLYNIPMPYWYSTNLSSDPQGPIGTFGTDNVGLGQSSSKSIVLAKQYVVAYTDQDFYMGWLGISAGTTGVQSGSRPNLLENLYGTTPNKTIASRSFGYTAGAHYQNNGRGVPGSLVLGGFDKSRLRSNNITISMPSVLNNTLLVGVQNIIWGLNPDVGTTTESFTTTSNRNGGFLAAIDSTLPYLILPDDICDTFAKKFQLTYDKGSNIYTVNASALASNRQQNATVSFKIGVNSADTDGSPSITLPYAAFDLELNLPGANSSTSYFPIKRSENGMYVLGRAFLQEAYIIVDYERSSFLIAPSVPIESTSETNLVTIFDKSYTGIPRTNQGSNGGLATGAIVGIVVGIIAVFIILGVGAFIFYRKRRNTKKQAPAYETTSEIDTMFAGNEVKHRRVSELTGSEAPQSPKESTTGYYSAEHKSIPPISELPPESPLAELYSSPPDGRDTFDYFIAGRMQRRGVTRDRDSSGNNTPRTPIAELSGEDVTRPKQLEKHGRSPSNTSLSTNIDEVLAGKQVVGGTESAEPVVDSGEPATAKEISKAKADTDTPTDEQPQHPSTKHRPLHTRGLSDITMQSDSTAVSQPTQEELERWARNGEEVPRRPMSP